ISPDGTRAVGARMYPRFPGNWMRDYLPFADNTYLVQRLAGFDEDETDMVTWIWHLVSFDLERGTETPLFDAPSGFDIAGYAMDLKWIDGGQRAIIGTSFLPLEAVASEERNRRRQSPAVIEYDFESRTANRVLDFAVPPGELKSSDSFAGLGILNDRYVVIE